MSHRLSRVLFVLLVGTYIGSTCRFALAWEFNMQGAFISTYEYYGQAGSRGFFGKENIDKSEGTAGPLGLKPGDFASLNGWVGYRSRDLVSGVDASQQYQNLELFPEIRINPAIRFRGMYWLGAYGDPIASNYVDGTSMGRYVATSDGQWTLWWVTAQIPWGILTAGKRPEIFGTGLQFDGTHNLTCESVQVVTFYGPFRMGLGVFPFWQEPAHTRLGQTVSPYYNLFDKNGLRHQATGGFITYQTGPLDMGGKMMLLRWRAGPESQNRQADRATFTPYDQTWRVGCLYTKYNNGRFFFNTELAFGEETTYRLGAGPLYNESWRYMTEAGIFGGPTKLSFLYVFMPGADRRHGAPINKQPSIQKPLIAAYGVFRPYTYLLGYAYGSGVNAFDFNRQGYINEAWVLAVRIDHAVAANLNVFGSFLWAERSSQGHGWGFIRPAQKSAVTTTVDSGGNAADQVKWTPYVNYKDNPGAPSIPDNGLGWEAMVGLDWKLLEGLQVNVLGSFWRPGKWFNYACIDRSVTNWDAPTAANRWGINPDRAINPIVGAQVTLLAEF
ncbi:MAG: hypothetical protein WBG50_19600 [Desulfomonilaceae bacterium]